MTERQPPTIVPGPSNETISHDELTDLRALQRTFDGAYARTALAQLSYAVIILRIFDQSFYWCGLVYTVLALLFLIIAIYRYNLAVTNQDRWSDVHLKRMVDPGQATSEPVDRVPQAHTSSQSSVMKRSFRTAGTVVLVTTVGTMSLEIALAVLLLQL